MSPTVRRLVLVITIVIVIVIGTALLYQFFMARFEGNPRDFWTALEWAAETLTSVGYGGESGWNNPIMILFVVTMQFTGILLVYSLVPIFLLPYLEERFETRLPRQAPSRMKDHIVIYDYSAAMETLLGELRTTGLKTLVLEPHESDARRLYEQRVAVIHTNGTPSALDGARLDKARVLIANSSDEANAAAILHARHLGFEGEIFALVENPDLRQPMALAGADAVLTPRHLLASALAARASHRLQPRVSGIQQLGRYLTVSELRVDPESELVGRTLLESNLRARTGVTVIGQWLAGRMQTATPDLRVEPRGILVGVGRVESFKALVEMAGGSGFESREGPYVVAGCGVVGDKVRELLEEIGEDVWAIDRNPGEHIHVAGDILDQEVLAAARLEEARAILLALDSDSATMFATVIIRDRVPDLPIIARVNEASNVERIHRAGADFALSISNVAGQILAQRLLSQEAISVNPHLRVLGTNAARLVGRRLAAAEIPRRTGCSVVAVERGDDVLVSLGRDFEFAADDKIYVCGSHDDTHRFTEVFG